MSSSAAITEYLNRKINESEAFQSHWTELKDYYDRRLWHQLTIKLQECFNIPEFRSQTNLVELNEIFLNDFKTKISPIALAELCVPISEQMVAENPENAVKFMEEVRDKHMVKSKEGAVLCSTTIGMIYLTTMNNLPKCRELIESTSKQLEQISGVNPRVHPRFYQLSSRYYQVAAQHADYYREALRFLGCVRLSDLTQEEQRAWAFSVGLAAILGEGVFNFGELLTHEVINSLRDSNEAWLVDLLTAFNRGDIPKLESLRDRWSTQQDLLAAETQLRDKVTLLCLTELIFHRPANKRTLQFDEISKATQVPNDKVEHFIMRALSLGLIKGRIDEVSRTLSISWLKPGVLDREQIGSMRSRVTEWCDVVAGMKNLVEADTSMILS